MNKKNNTKNKLSEIKSRKEIDNYIWKLFKNKLNDIDKSRRVSNFLDTFLTEIEKANMARRLAVISLLGEGKSYRDIEKNLWVSPGTISAIKKTIISKIQYQSNHKLLGSKKKPRKYIAPDNMFGDWLIDFVSSSSYGKGRWKHF